MFVFVTQMQLVTFILVNLEILFIFYLIIHKLERLSDKTSFPTIVLIFLLITFNINNCLLPDTNLPGTLFFQQVIVYSNGFIIVSYFPYYLYKAFEVEKMKYHAFKGIYFFLIPPYFLFVLLFAILDLAIAKYILILPVLFSLCIGSSLLVKYKHGDSFKGQETRSRVFVLLLCISTWVSITLLDLFDLGRVAKAIMANTGLLFLFGIQVLQQIKQMRIEQEELINSERRLFNWNINFQLEVEKQISELKRVNEQQTNTFINLVHEVKTPLTLVNIYLEEYINKYGSVNELEIIKGAINKLLRDVTGLFDIEKFTKGIDVYNHDQLTNFSEILENSLILFEHYCRQKNISCNKELEENIFIKADPIAIDRIVNNLIENAIKFSNPGGNIKIVLKTFNGIINFTVQDEGIGIQQRLHKKIFEPYFQINHKKNNLQGMGLGMPLVKMIIDSLEGKIKIDSNPDKLCGTKILITLKRHELDSNGVPESISSYVQEYKSNVGEIIEHAISDSEFLPNRPSIMIIEDQMALLKFLYNRLNKKYNIFCCLNGAEALKKLHESPVLPDLIISDILMDKMDGFTFARTISTLESYKHIPIFFLSAKTSKADKIMGLKLGAIDLIKKPFSFEIVNQKIETLLGNIKKQKSAILKASIANLKVLENERFSQSDFETLSEFDQACKLYNLSNREIEIVEHIRKGISYKLIGKTLFIAARTVTKHVENIFQKVGVSNKMELINKLH